LGFHKRERSKDEPMKKLLTIVVLICGIASAHAGDWPEVGDQFRSDDDSLFVVAKIKKRTDVSESMFCMHRSGTRALDRSCIWDKIGNLHGDWLTYSGVSQFSQVTCEGQVTIAHTLTIGNCSFTGAPARQVLDKCKEDDACRDIERISTDD
jgi:hypothetical protein